MPINATTVISGPHIQVDGQYHGQLMFAFNDGRTVSRGVRAANLADWNQLLADLPDVVQNNAEKRDADAGIGANTEITSVGEASAEQRAVAYLRAAMGKKRAIDAYSLLIKFNNYRLVRGWSMSQVAVNLAGAGLEATEWARIRTMYEYLSASGRPDIMANASAIQSQWDDR